MFPLFYEVESIGAGKLSVMAMPSSAEQFTELRQLGVDHVISLLDHEEQLEVGLKEEASHCASNGMRYTAFPIIDREVPDRDDAVALSTSVHHDISSGHHVLIHCRAGVGRSGVIACAVLVQAGYTSSEAIHMVSWARGTLVPDTVEQLEWIKSLDGI